MKRQITEWGPLGAAWLAYLVVAMDQVMLPGAASDVVRGLDTGINTIQIALALFSVVAASLYLTSGKLGDMYGRRLAFGAGVALMIAGSVTVIAAPGARTFVVGWALLRGMGFALILPNVFALLSVCYEGRRRDTAFALFATAGPVGAIVGPLVMGWAATELVWRSAFALDLVLLVISFILCFTMPPRTSRPREILDWPGAILALLGVGSIILAATLAGTYGWWHAARSVVFAGRTLYGGAVSIAPFVFLFGVITTAFLVARLRRLQSMGSTPLFRTALFRNHSFVTAWLSVMGLFFIFSSIVFTVPVFVQSMYGFDALETGWVITSFAFAMGLSGATSCLLRRRVPVRSLLAGSGVVAAIGLALAAVVVVGGDSAARLSGALAIAAVGLGVLIAQAPNAAMSAVAVGERGEAGGLNAVGEETGVGLGVAISGSLLISLGLGVAAMRTTLFVLAAVALVLAVIVAMPPGRVHRAEATAQK